MKMILYSAIFILAFLAIVTTGLNLMAKEPVAPTITTTSFIGHVDDNTTIDSQYTTTEEPSNFKGSSKSHIGNYSYEPESIKEPVKEDTSQWNNSKMEQLIKQYPGDKPYTSGPISWSGVPVPKYKFVGSINSGVYHKFGCPYADRIDEENYKYFFSNTNAALQGYRPCKYCHPN